MQYIEFDIHKRYTFYTQMDSAGQIRGQGKLPNHREVLAGFFRDVAEPVQVVIEASMNWYHLYDRHTNPSRIRPGHPGRAGEVEIRLVGQPMAPTNLVPILPESEVTRG